MKRLTIFIVILSAAARLSAQTGPVVHGEGPQNDWDQNAPGVRHLITVADLPEPFVTESANNGPHVVRRPDGVMPKAPSGFDVQLFLTGLHNPRKIMTAPNGDIFVAESGAGQIRVLRTNDDGSQILTKQVFAKGLHQPFGIAFYPPGKNPTYIYIGDTDAIVRFPYTNGDLQAAGDPEKICDLSGGGRLQGGGHWTRDVVFSLDGRIMYASVGSRSNVDDNPTTEKGRADVLRFNPDGSGRATFAWGIRNSVGLAVDPSTGLVWGSVNERDALGDDLPPDYITHYEEGGFYGWPWFYLGPHQDPRHPGAHPELASKVIVPDVLLQTHSASLCITFYTATQFPAEFRGGLFAAEHGSWNRARRTGYKVIYVPIHNGKAAGEYDDFLTGFVLNDSDVYGRPVGVTVDKTGALIVSDDGGECLWRVRWTGGK